MSWNETIQTRAETHRAEQHRTKRMSILRVAARAFNQNGYYHTSLTQLAAELNVTKPTLYYYVKNKDDILEGILTIAIEQFQAIVTAAERLDTTGLEKVRRFFADYAHLVSDDFGICLILMRINAPEEKFRRPYRNLSRDVFDGLQRMIQSGLDDGSIAPCNPKYMASALIGTLNETVYWHLAEGRDSPQNTAEKFFKVFEQGLTSS
ncbi:MAG: TetR/AcrR family transcriptional regulator [Ardenticatenaceae bacterium]|nr:TetR/AcrR family transcriptional regulator [Ardenticatenaceae bacterium]